MLQDPVCAWENQIRCKLFFQSQSYNIEFIFENVSLEMSTIQSKFLWMH